MLIGQADLKNIVLPAAIDPAQLISDEMVEGVTYFEILRDISDALILGAERTFSDPQLSGLFHSTTRSFAEYREGNGNGFEDHTEYGEPDAERAETGGHMLPIKLQDRKLGWSRDYLRKARRFQVEADIANAISDFEEIIPKRILARFFKKEAEAGRTNGLGQNGKSLPFCDGGDSGVTYTPPRGRDGLVFQSSHTHYLRLDGINQANVETATKHLWEHRHDGPYVLRGSLSDSAAWENTSNVTGFKPRGSILVSYGSSETLANVEDLYIGVITTKYGPVMVMLSARIPAGYWGLNKDYGSNDPRNSVWYRVGDMGRDPWLEVPTAKILPVQDALIMYEGGCGIGEDRTNGVLVKNASTGTYDTPVIS